MQPGLSSRRLRWLEQLQEFDISFEYVPGQANIVADMLSRPPVPDVELFDVTDHHVSSELGKWITLVAPHVTLADTISTARESLLAGRQLAAIRYPHCAALHLDTGSFAVRKHVTHLCCVPECGQ